MNNLEFNNMLKKLSDEIFYKYKLKNYIEDYTNIKEEKAKDELYQFLQKCCYEILYNRVFEFTEEEIKFLSIYVPISIYFGTINKELNKMMKKYIRKK